MSVVARLLGGELAPGPLPDVTSWWTLHRALALTGDPADVALEGGLAADRPAWAFASGYASALRALFPSLSPDEKVALAVTEDGGNHPRAIATTLEDHGDRVRVSGEKSFVTLGVHADAILVAATRGPGDDGRPRLAVVRVVASTEGLTLEAHPPAPFVPEVVHARARLDRVELPAAAVLPGDGYAEYVKPFRTVEDAHVATALGAHLVRVARQADAPEAVLAELVGIACSAHDLCGCDPRDPEAHVLLAATFGGLRRAATDPRLWDAAAPEVRRVWERDRAILRVAEKARKTRLETALLALRR